MRECREKILYLSRDLIEDILVIAVGGKDRCRVALPTIPGLPEGCQVESFHYEPMLKAFCVFVSHPSFPILGRHFSRSD